MLNTPENKKKLTSVIAQAWMSPLYKEQFLLDPKAKISEAGVEVPEDVEVIVVEDSNTVKNIVLDTEPLSENEIIRDLPPSPNFYQVYAYVYTKCIEDPAFKESFVAYPDQIIRALGIDLPAEDRVLVYENTDTKKYFILPVEPKVQYHIQGLQNEVALFSTDPVNANVNANANANVNINGDVNINGAVQVNGAAVAAVIVAVAVLI